jgi:hypothetical protein
MNRDSSREMVGTTRVLGVTASMQSRISTHRTQAVEVQSSATSDIDVIKIDPFVSAMRPTKTTTRLWT